jgi:uncharacterized protein (TIGR03435 family)
MKKLLLTLTALTILTPLTHAQTHPEFEAASVKQVDISKLGDAISSNIGSIQGDQITFTNATLNDCIRFAYNIASDAQIQGPDWIRSKQFLYNIEAKAAPGTSREEFQSMLQTLLTERFKLVTHRDQKAMSYYALVPAKSGPKMKPVENLPTNFQGITHGGHIDSILPMPMLAYLLSRFETERPIIDKTNLTGLYPIKLDWALKPAENSTDPQGPSLFTALSEQLGLKLEPTKGPVEILVVDSADKSPTQN